MGVTSPPVSPFTCPSINVKYEHGQSDIHAKFMRIEEQLVKLVGTFCVPRQSYDDGQKYDLNNSLFRQSSSLKVVTNWMKGGLCCPTDKFNWELLIIRIPEWRHYKPIGGMIGMEWIISIFSVHDFYFSLMLLLLLLLQWRSLKLPLLALLFVGPLDYRSFPAILSDHLHIINY